MLILIFTVFILLPYLNRNLSGTLRAIWAELREGDYPTWFRSAFSVGTKLTFLDERPQTRYAQTRGLNTIQNVR